jgi:hypothetical protein
VRQVGYGFILQPDGLIHTSPGQRPGWAVVVGGQAESLHHTWLVGSAVYEADFQPAMCFLKPDPGRRPTDSVLPRASMSEPVGLMSPAGGFQLWVVT